MQSDTKGDVSEKRLAEVTEVLVSYSLGDFDAKASLTKNLDSFDVIVSGVNMLGEELKETTVSRNYLHGVFQAITEMIFVLDQRGKVLEYNDSAGDNFGEKGRLIGQNIHDILFEYDDTRQITLLSARKVRDARKFRLYSQTNVIECLCCYYAPVYDRVGGLLHYVLVLRDLTLEIESEQRVIRTVLDTQEKERQRIAKDLHDAIGSELGILKPMLNSVLNTTRGDDERGKSGLKMCIETVTGLMESIRNTCYAVAPNNLANKGFNYSLKRYCEFIALRSNVKVWYSADDVYLEEDCALSLYRVAQEFIQNTLKHAKADQILISLKNFGDGHIHFSLEDNGVGFDKDDVDIGKGRGVQNMRTRIEVFGGKFELISSPQAGTRIEITL